MSPRVSILIPCYNAERWIKQAIESALAQTWVDKEIIVFDDGSTDKGLDVIRQFDGLIKWHTGANQGSNITRNLLLEAASGEWVQYLDADDYLLPEKLARQMEFLRLNPNCDVVYSPTAWKRVENGVILCSESPIPEPRDPWILLALWLLPQTGGALWKTATLRQVGGWQVELPCCQEHELYLRLLENGVRFAYCSGCFAVYRDHDAPGRITRQMRHESVLQRLHILTQIEKHLHATAALTAPRRQAINDARHQLARWLWNTDRHSAKLTYKCALESDSSFRPSISSASPLLYLWVLRTLGFERAQVVAEFRRKVKLW